MFINIEVYGGKKISTNVDINVNDISVIWYNTDHTLIQLRSTDLFTSLLKPDIQRLLNEVIGE